MVRQAADVREIIGLAGQSAAIQEELTGRENLVYRGPPLPPGPDPGPSHADELLDRFELTTPPTGSPRPTRAACSAASTWPPAW